jgi:hypothetical protein
MRSIAATLQYDHRLDNEKSLEGCTGGQCGADGLKFTDADYADDIAFMEETEQEAQKLLDVISENEEKIDLRINAKKTKCMTTDDSKVNLSLRGEPIEQVEFK